MTTLEQLQQANPDIQIEPIFDDSFALYGRVIDLPHQDDLIATLATDTQIPTENNVYVRDDPQFLSASQRADIAREFYGEQPIEIGYCNGNSDRINAFEFHNCSELNLAGTDMVLWLAHRQILSDGRMSTQSAHAYFVPRGTAIEVYPTTLHFAPNRVHVSGFKCLVILTDKTNTPLTSEREPDDLLFQYNKWLLTHPDNQRMVNNGAFIGLSGDNLHINFLTEANAYE